MRGIDVHMLMQGLAARRPVFHSEADFQHALAWRVHELSPKSAIRLEYRVTAISDPTYLDIWVALGQARMAIELKYKTKVLGCEVKGEDFDLRDQAAQDLARYDFLWDIQRLEAVRRALKNFRGWSILLTNDSSYWKQSTRQM